MPPLNRLSVLIAAALAVATPLLAGSMAWHYLDDAQRSGVGYVLLYWPSILLSHLPPRLADGFTVSALPTVMLYFIGYVLACQFARVGWAAWKAREAAGHDPVRP